MSHSDLVAMALVERLRAAGCLSPAAEFDEIRLRAPDEVTLERWVGRRETGEPLAWITGSTAFGGLMLHVERGVYVPRPHTEELARRAAEALPEGGRAVDLCTGSGAIAAFIMSHVAGSHVIGVDVDPTAAACARRNGIGSITADLGEALRSRSVDVVTAAPPYVPTDDIRLLPSDVQRFEPRLALDGGLDGLDVVRRAVTSASNLLRAGGWLLVELGGDQDKSLATALERDGFTVGSVWSDEDGELRGLAARLAA
jgi:release factor glutamine methyltransferase